MGNLNDTVNELNTIDQMSDEKPAKAEPNYPTDVKTPTGESVKLSEHASGIHQNAIKGSELKK